MNGEEEGFIEGLFRHNTWANVKLLEACEGLSDEQLDSNVAGTFGSIRDTLVHIVGAEVSYVQRVTGQLPGEPPKPGEIPTINRLKHDAQWSGEELLKIAVNAKPTDIVRRVRDGKVASYKLVGLLTQAINHATEHRVQVATILTQQGIEPPDMSGWEYMVSIGQWEELAQDGAEAK